MASIWNLPGEGHEMSIKERKKTKDITTFK